MATLTTTITCPKCGHAAVESMPTDRCVFFYECVECQSVLKPRAGDCCVFCSYGTEGVPTGTGKPSRPSQLTPWHITAAAVDPPPRRQQVIQPVEEAAEKSGAGVS